jgi:hypothetical protein
MRPMQPGAPGCIAMPAGATMMHAMQRHQRHHRCIRYGWSMKPQVNAAARRSGSRRHRRAARCTAGSARSDEPPNDAPDAIPPVCQSCANVCRNWCGCTAGSYPASSVLRCSIRYSPDPVIAPRFRVPSHSAGEAASRCPAAPADMPPAPAPSPGPAARSAPRWTRGPRSAAPPARTAARSRPPADQSSAVVCRLSPPYPLGQHPDHGVVAGILEVPRRRPG